MKTLLIVLLSCTTVIFSQDIPLTINYQGILKDESGSVVSDGDYNITFNLYESETTEAISWSETKLISVSDGIINTQLGSVTALSVPFDREYWLGITIETGAELTPRIKLSAVPYSLMTNEVMNGSITTAKLTDDAVTKTKLADNSVSTEKIIEGTVTAEDIGGGQVIKKINGIKDSVNFIEGNNITITPTGNTITISSSGTATGIGGNGTAGYIPVFTGNSEVGNSEIYESGGNIGIGTAAPSAKFTLAGSDALINGLTLGKGNGNINTNTAAGFHSLYVNTSGYHNLAIGYASMSLNETGTFNSAAGVYALQKNTSGNLNAAFGYSALSTNTTGNDNTALGSISLVGNTTGYSNTAVGSGSLWANNGNSGNTAVGYHSMYYADNRTEGRYTGNTAVGTTALRGTVNSGENTGQFNTAISDQTLYSNSSGYENTAVGAGSLLSNSEGYENVAIGSGSMRNNLSGHSNTAAGRNSLYNNTTGINNTGIGEDAAFNNLAGQRNTAVGKYSVYVNINGSENTAVGYSAGDYSAISYGTFIGSNCYSTLNLTNVTGIGYNTRPTESNQVVIGNSSVTSIGGAVNWGIISDGRFKTSVTENVAGIDFIMKLRPVTYKLDINKLAAELKEDLRRDENGNSVRSAAEGDVQARSEKAQITYSGFIGQEVDQAASELGYDFSGVNAPKNENDFYSLRYAEFVVPLVKAMQEQQAIIEQLTRRIEELEKGLTD